MDLRGDLRDVASTLKLRGGRVGRGLNLGLLLAAGLLGGLVAYATGALLYAGAVAWAFLGIVVANRVRDHDGVIAAIAGLLIPAVLAAAWLGKP